MKKRKKLADGVYLKPNGRIFLRATIRPSNKRLQETFPNDRPLSEFVKLREEWIKDFKKAENEDGSLTINTLGDALKFWRESPNKKTGLKKKLTNQETRYNRLIDEVGHAPIEESYKYLHYFREKYEGEFSNGYLNRHFSIAKAAVNHAYNFRQGIDFKRTIPENYLSGFSLLREDNIRYRILSPDERDRLWDNLPDYLKPIYYFACRIPMRLFELGNLKREDINPFTKIITVKCGTTKNGLGRSIVIMPEFMDYVMDFYNSPAEYLFNRGPELDYAPLGYYNKERGGIVFNCKKAWLKALKNADIKDYNFHKSRQEAVLNLCQEGYEEGEIMQMGGWKDHKAFDRYFNRDLALLIRRGRYNMQLRWYNDYAKDIIRKAA